MEYKKVDKLIQDIKSGTIDINEKPELIQFVEYEEDYHLLLSKLSLLKSILGYNYFTDNRIEAIAKKMQAKRYDGMFYKNGLSVYSSHDKNTKKIEIQKLRKYIIIPQEVFRAYQKEFQFRDLPNPLDVMIGQMVGYEDVDIKVVKQLNKPRHRYEVVMAESENYFLVSQVDEYTGLPLDFVFEGKEKDYIKQLIESYI
ncbi:hypothetical protein [Billgrantia endophytica]|uniref:Uncharacterized protein n=1 Tax=Billgrantia endophytica TaxID=2033802 RepID=A0A2N7TUD7_9GAMM|nr:hypothetical protein [Halomonas endophytica]PMR71800.1 hypothetical protein C1H69_22975 [Halomonas endophytica]